MTVTTDNPLSEREQRMIERVLDQLERTSTRTSTQYARQREHERKVFRGMVSIHFPEPERPFPAPDGSGCEQLWMYSLSRGGVGFISRYELPRTELFVGIHMPNGSIRWLQGQLVRCREIPEEEFFDCGVAFSAAHNRG